MPGEKPFITFFTIILQMPEKCGIILGSTILFRIFMQRRKAEHGMRTLSIQQITDSVRLTSFTDPSFKTMALSANLLLPLSQETAAKRGILPSLASRATIEFPNYTALNTRLSQLYGASVHSSVRKLGDYQVFGLAASGISSRYAFGGENMAEELCRILASI